MYITQSPRFQVETLFARLATATKAKQAVWEQHNSFTERALMSVISMHLAMCDASDASGRHLAKFAQLEAVFQCLAFGHLSCPFYIKRIDLSPRSELFDVPWANDLVAQSESSDLNHQIDILHRGTRDLARMLTDGTEIERTRVLIQQCMSAAIIVLSNNGLPTEPKTGVLALCGAQGKGRLGLILEDGKQDVTYLDGTVGKAYTGVHLAPFEKVGNFWSTRLPAPLISLDAISTLLKPSPSESVPFEELKLLVDSSKSRVYIGPRAQGFAYQVWPPHEFGSLVQSVVDVVSPLSELTGT